MLKKPINLRDRYNYYYMISLYNLMHTYKCEWEFLTINEKQVLNGTDLKYDDFHRNPYLQAHENNKIGLAEDIMSKGMYFPYFVYGLPNEQPSENSISLALGKHRYYSKLLYQKKYGQINKKFLFIYVPNKLSYVDYLSLSNFFYEFNGAEVILTDKIFTFSQRELMKYFDHVGGTLSQPLLIQQIETNPILNNEELFKQFIESPLDENNIMFKYYEELKEKIKTDGK